MDADLWKQVDALLEEALAQPPADRQAFVEESARDNPELRDEVLSLLKAQSQASSFMERSAIRVAAAALAQDPDLTTSFSLIGKELGTYKIEKLLGAGGMGEVYLARETKLNRMVALKILPWEFVSDADRAARFQREARALSSLNHPNLVTVYEVGEANGLHFIAMEFVEGQTLSSLREKLSLKELLSIVAQVSEALWAAHQAGIIHRDIKPDNVMVRADGYAKVLDFGLVKLNEVAVGSVEPDGANTQLGIAMGTLAYMSPEQAAGEAVDHRTDIWSLGVVLYELVTGQRPFRGETRQAFVNAILSSDPKLPTTIDANLPTELDLILNKALEKERDLRYQTASDFRSDIRRLLRSIDSSATASTARSVTTSFASFTQRPWFRLLVILGALVGVAVTLGWYFISTKSRAPDWSKASHAQLTNQAGTEFFPSLAPDGKNFVYASDVGGTFDLYLQRVGGKTITPLTPNTPTDEFEAAFSPDGKRIAFFSNRAPAGIFVMEETGENVRSVTPDCHHPSWSPDGKEIVCSVAGKSAPTTRNTRPSSLWIADVETGVKRLLSESDAMQPAWSPSGARIAFWFMPPGEGRSDIATIAKTGGQIEVVTKDAPINWNPVWSPDGKFLYFASDRSGNMGIWRVAIDQETGKVLGEPEAVATPATFNRHLSFSRDGRRLLYVQTDRQSNIQAVNFDSKLAKTIGEPFWITRGDRQVVRPELSPDGTQFVMRIPRRTQDDIVVVNREGKTWHDITDDKFFDRYPRWSPDGKQIVFTSDRSGFYEIWVINSDGTGLRQLSFDSPGSTFPLWSPDGSRILFHRNKKNVIIDINQKWSAESLQTLAEPDKTFVAWDWSPDGKKLIGSFVGGQIGYFSFETNRYERMATIGAYPYWLPDSLRYISLWDDKAYLGNILTKEVREIFKVREGKIGSIAISRDGQLMYFSVYSEESDVWILDLP